MFLLATHTLAQLSPSVAAKITIYPILGGEVSAVVLQNLGPASNSVMSTTSTDKSSR